MEPSPEAAIKDAARSPASSRSLSATVGNVVARDGGIPWELFAVAATLGIVFCWAYWPTLAYLAGEWDRSPDYSHGYFVVPIALYIAWSRRATLPPLTGSFAWAALTVLLAASGLRVLGTVLFLEPVDGWSLILWIVGAIWFCCGYKILIWALPAVSFLVFMVPLPYRLETALSLPLQQTAAAMATWTLQSLAQPAISEGTTIWLGDFQLEVERACSGLRMFYGISALAYLYLVLVKRPLWQRVALLASLLPIALVANTIRIAATGLLYQYVSSEAAQVFSHDVAGWLMIPLAAAFFGVVLWYLNALVVEFEPTDQKRLLRRFG